MIIAIIEWYFCILYFDEIEAEEYLVFWWLIYQILPAAIDASALRFVNVRTGHTNQPR
jgi:hypothetical protein